MRHEVAQTLTCCCPRFASYTATIHPPGITYLTNSKVTAASVANRTLTLANGDVVSYDKLVIATGARVGAWGEGLTRCGSMCGDAVLDM